MRYYIIYREEKVEREAFRRRCTRVHFFERPKDTYSPVTRTTRCFPDSAEKLVVVWTIVCRTKTSNSSWDRGHRSKAITIVHLTLFLWECKGLFLNVSKDFLESTSCSLLLVLLLLLLITCATSVPTTLIIRKGAVHYIIHYRPLPAAAHFVCRCVCNTILETCISKQYPSRRQYQYY